MAHPPSKSTPKSAGGLFSRAARLLSGNTSAAGSPWLPQDTPYPRLASLNPAAAGLARRAGIYACWHLGVRPQWIRVGASADLGASILALQQRREVTDLDRHGGVYVAWGFAAFETLPGAVSFLATQLTPILQGLAITGEVAVAATGVTFPFPPGTTTTETGPPKGGT